MLSYNTTAGTCYPTSTTILIVILQTAILLLLLLEELFIHWWEEESGLVNIIVLPIFGKFQPVVLAPRQRGEKLTF